MSTHVRSSMFMFFQYEVVSSVMTGGFINAGNTFTAAQCPSLNDESFPVHTVVCGNNGFTGVYEPDPASLVTLVQNNLRKANINGTAAIDSLSSFTGRRRLLATTTFNGSTFSGIQNPIVCLENGEFVLFAVDNSNYPVYDK